MLDFDVEKYRYFKVDMSDPRLGFVLFQDTVEVGKDTKYYTRAKIVETINDSFVLNSFIYVTFPGFCLHNIQEGIFCSICITYILSI